ncbi:MAG: NAD(P)-dependent oxidoreductase [Roseibacillus sp.]|jgi:ribose 1,5-bisphosphokinase PhnN
MGVRTNPEFIESEEALEEVLTHPRRELIEAIAEVRSPLVILGAGGKMGPSLAVLAKRAAQEAGHQLDIIAVSRFRAGGQREWLEQRGIRTLSADLLDRARVEELPEAGDVLYLVGLKFGTQENPSLTWAINTVAPHHAAERYRGRRMVALSTGNVYPLTEVGAGGSVEDDALTPVGEYANAVVARERIFDYFSRESGGAPVALLRLNYATDLRYGVPVDLARKIWTGVPIDLSNGSFNCIWQGDANEMILRAFPLAASPARAWNLTSPQAYRIREVAEELGSLLGREPIFTGSESDTALLSNAGALCAELGEPPTDLPCILARTAHWVKKGGRELGKPTHFEVRDGRY